MFGANLTLIGARDLRAFLYDNVGCRRHQAVDKDGKNGTNAFLINLYLFLFFILVLFIF